MPTEGAPQGLEVLPVPWWQVATCQGCMATAINTPYFKFYLANGKLVCQHCLFDYLLKSDVYPEAA